MDKEVEIKNPAIWRIFYLQDILTNATDMVLFPERDINNARNKMVLCAMR